MGTLKGANFFNGFASGGLGSLAGSGFQSLDTKFTNSKWGGASFGALSGGIGAELSGGDFWRGAGQGASVALLNHYGKQLQQRLERPSKINIKKNPVSGFKRWMRYIHRHNGVDPFSRRAFNLSDIVDYSTVPRKHWFMEMFGMMNDISGTSKINGKYVKWYIEDRTISPGSQNDINYIDYGEISGQGNVQAWWTIGGYKYQQIGRFNLVFYDYETYQDFYNFIFKQ